MCMHVIVTLTSLTLTLQCHKTHLQDFQTIDQLPSDSIVLAIVIASMYVVYVYIISVLGTLTCQD